MKKRWIIIGFIGIILLCFIAFRYVHFSSTIVKVVDLNKEPLANAYVTAEYRCETFNLDIGGGHHYVYIGEQKNITNNDGVITFNSFNKWPVLNLPFPIMSCEKRISTYKEGYCPNETMFSQMCLGNYIETLMNYKPEVFNTEIISWNDKNATLILKKIELKDISICKKKYIVEATKEIEECEFNIIKSIGNPSNCPLLKLERMSKLCEDYFK